LPPKLILNNVIFIPPPPESPPASPRDKDTIADNNSHIGKILSSSTPPELPSQQKPDSPKRILENTSIETHTPTFKMPARQIELLLSPRGPKPLSSYTSTLDQEPEKERTKPMLVRAITEAHMGGDKLKANRTLSPPPRDKTPPTKKTISTS